MRPVLVMLVAACASSPAAREDHPRPTTNVGTGHPYWKQLSRDARASLGNGAPPTMCLVLRADGTILGGKFVPDAKGNVAVAEALRKFMDARNAHPVAVPAELRTTLDGWVCMPVEAPPSDDTL